MAIQWLDFDLVTYDGYISTARDPRLKSAERAGAAPAPPAPSDVQYVNDLADDFADGVVHDNDGPEWAIAVGAALFGTGFVVGLGACCIIGAVAVARWLGWVA
jgi:hypothetical protein